ncbi:MAG: MacS family sensor histidine kinase [Jatrophihabitans sp.]|uniref:MacS family sensor histidine kinase n=1 Tax=Jatrophihabitans sp. TaxID=1932789 RepID=UPI003F7FF827
MSSDPPGAPVGGVRLSLWRAAVGFRLIAAALCLYRIVRWRHLYAHAWVAWSVAAAIVVVTAVVLSLALAGRAHRHGVVLADLVVSVLLTLGTLAAQTPAQLHGGMPTLTTVWAAGAVVGVGFVTGWLGGVLAAVVQFAASVVVREGYDGNTLANGALLLIVGAVAGYLATRTRRAELALAAAVAEASAAAEREKLARSIHDGVLQVLGLVHRKGLAAGGEWADLAEAAATQESALRALITSRALPAPGGGSLAVALAALRSERVTVSLPPDDVALTPERTTEVVAMVEAALHNVTQHAGSAVHAWVLLEVLGDRLCVTVRDDGVGVTPERLAEAAAQGRFGVARSIQGRARELGGHAEVRGDADGTEVEIEVPLVAPVEART